MAQPDALQLTRAELRNELARFMSYGAYTEATTQGQKDINSFIKRGLRQFYNPPPVPGMSGTHSWSFLQPWATLATVANQQSYDLPAHFGGLAGDMSYSTEQSKPPVENVGEANFRRISTDNPTRKDRPSICAILPKDAADTEYPDSPSRFTMYLWPIPDAVYSLQYRYVAVQGDEDEASNATFIGGAQHSETILASCLSIAEEYVETPNSRYKELFAQRLAASVLLDARMNTPDNMGQNLDRSDMRGRFRLHSNDYTVSYFDIDGNQVGP